MESVPETERLEEFKSSPRPSLRLQNPSTPTKHPRSSLGPVSPLTLEPAKRPSNFCRSTDPTNSPRLSTTWSQMQNPSQSSVSVAAMPYRPRNASPLTFGATTKSARHALINHGRSKSHLGLGLSRTQSLPGVNGSGHLFFSPTSHPASPSSSPQRTRVPRRNPDDIFPTSPVRTSVLENSPRRHSPSASLSGSYGSASNVIPFPSMNSAQMLGTLPLGSSPLGPSPLAAAAQITVAKVRPSSPPRSHSLSASLMSSPMSLGRSSLDSDINFGGSGTSGITTSFNNYTYSTNFSNLSIPSLPASSVPSTPTSARSRSPSLSSLETIEDTPDAEEAAVEEDLKAAAEAAAKGEVAPEVKPAKEVRGGRGFRDKRKRWSVCGAERRGDLDLETIWED